MFSLDFGAGVAFRVDSNMNDCAVTARRRPARLIVEKETSNGAAVPIRNYSAESDSWHKGRGGG